MAYDSLARYYDQLTKNVQYRRRARFIGKTFRKYSIEGLILDAGCGTGTLTIELAKMGYEMIGVDISGAMLSVAQSKNAGIKNKALLIQQDLAQLDLFGTVQGIICMQDTLSHMGNKLDEVIGRFSLFIEQGGIFIFDINTRYKHEKVLAEEFCFPVTGGQIRWCSSYDAQLSRVLIELSFDEGTSSKTEQFYEYDISKEQLQILFETHRFKLLEVMDGETYKECRPTTQRELYITKKI